CARFHYGSSYDAMDFW
nr:immunoglobulin heavy chain junction region [Mus musculus]